MTEPTAIAPAVEWHPFDYDDEVRTAPSHANLVWIVDRFAGYAVGPGYYDGQTFRDYSGSDDISVSHWAEIEFPDPPAGCEAADDDD